MTSEHPFVYEKPITKRVRNEAWKSKQTSFARLNRNHTHRAHRHFDLTRCVGNYIPYIPHFSKYGIRALIGEN